MVCLIFDWYWSTLGVVNQDLSGMWYERRNAFLGPKAAYISCCKVRMRLLALKRTERSQVDEPLLGNCLAFS